MFDRFRADLARTLKFYPSSNESIGQALAEALSLDPATVVVGNGSTELITWIDLLLVRGGLATPVPTFGRWTDHPRELGRPVHVFPLRPEVEFALDVAGFARFARRRATAAVVCNPNNPTGSLVAVADALRLLDELSHLDVVVLDESFVDFADEESIPTLAAEAARRDNLIVLKSLGKNFGLHGVRAGYAVANPRLAGRLRRALPHWNVNALAEALIRSLAAHLGEYEAGRRQVVRDRIALEGALRGIEGLRVYASRASFVYCRATDVDGAALRDRLLCAHGCLVRQCGNKVGSDARHLRIAARPRAELELLTAALRESIALVRGAAAPA
jgi:histidinol-phosphate/aromatic aminotransferase/cobyric acid decarboxylase-like protein